MAAKQVPFQSVPRRATAEVIDAFVHGSIPPAQEQPPATPAPPVPAPVAPPPAKVVMPMKRLTFDIPADLHMRMKLACVREGVDMAEVLRELIAKRFP